MIRICNNPTVPIIRKATEIPFKIFKIVAAEISFGKPGCKVIISSIYLDKVALSDNRILKPFKQTT